MATREGTLQIAKKKVPLIPLLSILCFISIFFLLSQFKSTSTSHHSLPTFQIEKHEYHRGSCDYSDGTWIHDPSRTPRYDNTCKEIFKGWNCLSAHKSNAPHLSTWRWQPRLCDLPQFDPAEFLRTHTHTNIGTLTLSFWVFDSAKKVALFLGLLMMGVQQCRVCRGLAQQEHVCVSLLLSQECLRWTDQEVATCWR